MGVVDPLHQHLFGKQQSSIWVMVKERIAVILSLSFLL